MLELMQNEINSTHLNESYLKPALYSNKLLICLINDMLDFVQMDNGSIKFVFIEFDLRELIWECVQMIRFKAKLKNLKVIYVIRHRVPAKVNSDKNRIR